MKHLLFLILNFVFATTLLAQGDPLYRQRIDSPANLRAEAKDALQDLREYLSRMTGKEFTVHTEDAESGILLRRSEDKDAPAAAVKMLPPDSKEAFVLWPTEGRLWIIGRSDYGVTHAIYHYLEHLGCRWYFPSDRWTVVPHTTDIRLKQPLARAPAFRSRVFAGTGGFGGSLPIDPKRELQARWTTWQRRNGFGGEFKLGGHTGEAFNTKYRQLLEEHPEYRAMINGERPPWNLILQICPSNKEVVDIYAKDRVEHLRQARKTDPGGPYSSIVSVEPADGSMHCEAPASKAMGSISDRVFHVANVSAKAVKKEFPDAWVSLYAYNMHAPVPSIPLEPNIYVQVIPYAFQRTGLSAEELIDAWSKKVPRMGIYDYWSIPDWTHDLPTFDFLGFGPQRLRYWHSKHIDSFSCESTYSSGAMGPAWYIAARLAWDPKADEHALFEDFLTTSFGPAAQPMRQMLVRWTKDFHLTSHEIALSLRDLEEAQRLAVGNELIRQRLSDYARYVGYLREYFEYLQADAATKPKQREQLMLYCWSIYDSTMIHAFRETQLIHRDGKADPTFYDAFVWNNPQAPFWGKIKRMTDEEALQMVRDAQQTYQPLRFEPRKYQGEMVPVTKDTSGTGKQSAVFHFSNSLEFSLLTTKPNEEVTFPIGTDEGVRLKVRSETGEQILSGSLQTQEKDAMLDQVIKLPKPGLYRVSIFSPKKSFRMSFPDNIRITTPGWYNSQGRLTPKIYFYVPREVTRLAIYAEYIAAGPPRFYDPAGTLVKPEFADRGKMILIDVPAEHRGQIWSLDRAACPLGPLHMLNAPNSFAFHPAGLLVPKEALGE